MTLRSVICVHIGARYASWCATLGADVAAWDPFAPDAIVRFRPR